MLLYRVFPYDPSAPTGTSGHASFLYRPQGAGRWDNNHLYGAWYLAASPAGAIGETFGNVGLWSDAMFIHPATGLRRALATFSVPDNLSLVDFDDPAALSRWSMRPTQVVTRNPSYTQGKAAEIFQDQRGDGSPAWHGLRWWSFWQPTWVNTVLFDAPDRRAPLTLTRVTALSMASPAVVDAAASLTRPLSSPARRAGTY